MDGAVFSFKMRASGLICVIYNSFISSGGIVEMFKLPSLKKAVKLEEVARKTAVVFVFLAEGGAQKGCS